MRRIGIILYDAVLLVALLMIAAALVLPLTGGDVVAGKDPWFTAYLLLVWFGYLAVCWRRGSTLGMRAWKVRLLSETDQPFTWTRCATRFAVAGVSWAAVGLGYLWMLFDPQRRCWHDFASNSRLVRA